IINKSLPQVPFEKKPAEIYRRYEGETTRSHARREREGFFDKYCRGEGIDIGYGGDILTPDCAGWGFRNGDAQYLSGIEDESFDFAYSSHCLEHMYDVRVALKNWFRVVRRGGYLLLAIPHRDLYEKKTQLPSRWNADHKHMFLIGRAEPPDTLDIIEEIRESLSNYDIKYVKACDEGHTITDPLKHSDGEYQIELVIQKL
ncbi:MAG: class I SAM-dependent methyltransferase, partial [Selenomonadaceae bacterium]|nr:class I SAM-dependent methyltransferase [Selenomonadaceae bacterium]